MSARPTFPLTLGSVGATKIIADLHDKGVGAHPWDLVKVRLSAAYAPVQPPGYPEFPPVGGEVKVQTKRAAAPLAANTTMFLFAHEASALVAAGAAVYA